MIALFLDIYREPINKNLYDIFYPLFSNNYYIEIMNLNIAANVNAKNKIIKKYHSNILHEKYRETLLIVSYNSKGEYFNSMAVDENKIMNFKITFKENLKYFLKNSKNCYYAMSNYIR